MNNLKTIFFGTSEFGLPTLEWLKANTELMAVVTTPDRPVGRSQELLGSPVKNWALANHLPVLQPETLKDAEFSNVLRDLNADVAILTSYGKIVPGFILDIPRHGTLNLHPSLLPKYRGATPIQSALLAGETKTGTTVMLMDEELDHGPIVAQREVPISVNEDYTSLHAILAHASVELLSETLPAFIAGTITPKDQDHTAATYTKKLTKEDGRIVWQNSANQINNQIRALNPWPSTYTELSDDRILKIYKVALNDRADLVAGQVLIEGKKMFVGTGDGSLEIIELQISGGKRILAEQFIAGLRDELKFK